MALRWLDIRPRMRGGRVPDGVEEVGLLQTFHFPISEDAGHHRSLMGLDRLSLLFSRLHADPVALIPIWDALQRPSDPPAPRPSRFSSFHALHFARPQKPLARLPLSPLKLPPSVPFLSIHERLLSNVTSLLFFLSTVQCRYLFCSVAGRGEGGGGYTLWELVDRGEKCTLLFRR